MLQNFYDSTKPDKLNPEKLSLKLSDFCPPDKVRDSVFTLDWKAVNNTIWEGRRELAVLRCLQVLKMGYN
jgi:hypothetical protein